MCLKQGCCAFEKRGKPEKKQGNLLSPEKSGKNHGIRLFTPRKKDFFVKKADFSLRAKVMEKSENLSFPAFFSKMLILSF